MDTTYISFFVIAALAILTSLSVFIVLIIRGNPKSCVTFLLFWFHVSLIGQEITILPYISAGRRSNCEALEFLHYFFGLMNILVLICLTQAHRCSVLPDPWETRQRMYQYGSYAFIILPSLGTLPFLAHILSSEYQTMNDDANMDSSGGRIWCTLSAIEGEHSRFLAFYYMNAWTILILALVNMIRTIITVKQMNKDLTKYLISTIGLFVIVAILSWIPRSISRSIQLLSKDDTGQVFTHFIAFYPLEISGILFGLIFYCFEQKSRAIFQDIRVEDDWDQRASLSFTWERNDLIAFLNDDFTNATSSRSTSVAFSTSTITSGIFNTVQNTKNIASAEMVSNCNVATDAAASGASTTTGNPLVLSERRSDYSSA